MNALRTILLPTLALMAGAGLVTIAATPGNPVRGAARGSVPSSVPAPNLTRPATATRPPDPDGFIQRWLVLEPIPQSIRSNQQLVDSYVQTALKRDYFPNQFTVVPHDGEKVVIGGADYIWHAVDTSTYNLNLYHFAYALGKPRFNVLFWAVTIVDCPQELPGVRLAVGSNAASIWWVNGEEVIGIYGDRHMVIDDGVSKRLTLHKGPNVVRCGVINAPGVSDFCARFLDKEDAPVTAFSVKLEQANE
jgi:hypothetical protein